MQAGQELAARADHLQLLLRRQPHCLLHAVTAECDLSMSRVRTRAEQDKKQVTQLLTPCSCWN